jgi:hypothetical protein
MMAIQGKVPKRLRGTPAHQEAQARAAKGFDVWWSSGEVVGESSMANYSLWDHYDPSTGEPLPGSFSNYARRRSEVGPFDTHGDDAFHTGSESVQDILRRELMLVSAGPDEDSSGRKGVVSWVGPPTQRTMPPGRAYDKRKGLPLNNTNLIFLGTGLDRNGNKIAKFRIGSQRAFSIQTNQNMPQTHNAVGMAWDGRNLRYLGEGRADIIRNEAVRYLRQHGSSRQKRTLFTQLSFGRRMTDAEVAAASGRGKRELGFARRIDGMWWDRHVPYAELDGLGRDMAHVIKPISKTKAKRIADNIRTKKAGGGYYNARVIAVKGGYVVFTIPKSAAAARRGRRR